MNLQKKSVKKIKMLFVNLMVMALSLFINNTATAQSKVQMVRLAKLVIDSAQLKSYKAALTEEIETSLRLETGVITLYAVSEKDKPTHITIVEIYADIEAYKSHIKSSHFQKYKTFTKDMVKSLELAEAVPLIAEMKIK